MKTIIPYIIFLGLIVLIAESNTPSEENIRRGKWCQKTAVERNYGVTYDRETSTYYYSKNKFEKLRYYDFMIECLSKDDPGRREMFYARAALKKEIDKAIQELGIGATNRD